MVDLSDWAFTTDGSSVAGFSYEGMLEAMDRFSIPDRPSREQMVFEGHGVSLEVLKDLSAPVDDRVPFVSFGVRVEVVNTFVPGYYQFWEGPNGATLRVASEDQHRVARIKQMFGEDFFEPSFMLLNSSLPRSSSLLRKEASVL